MPVKITLKQALQIWKQEIEKRPATTVFHPHKEWIEKFSRGEDVPDKEKWIQHLANCHKCRGKWYTLTKKNNFLSQYTDIALPKVAFSQKNLFDTITQIDSSSGLYNLTLRNNLEQPDSCLITLNVLLDKQELENQQLIVRDKNRKVLLSGQVIQGELSGWLHQLDDVDISAITIMPEISEDDE